MTYQYASRNRTWVHLVLGHVTEPHIWPQKATKGVVFPDGVWRPRLLSASLFPLNASCRLYGAQCSIKPRLLGRLDLI